MNRLKKVIQQRGMGTESTVYLCLWLLVGVFFLLNDLRIRNASGRPLADWPMLIHFLLDLAPYVALFAVNNRWLIPRYLLRNRLHKYFILAAMAVLAVWFLQGLQFVWELSVRRVIEGEPFHGPFPRPLLPLPMLLAIIYDLLIVGGNIAVSLMFQRYADKLERESLLKANAEAQLTSLKAQINPHFYMNMLNNIHGLIEIDPVKAQEMVIDMSRLMRYLLYESSQPSVSLISELEFCENYMDVMRQRYPYDRVRVTSRFPSAPECASVSVPPLIFLVFIENAFKHGISYKEESYVAVSVEVTAGRIIFSCINSSHTAPGTNERRGIGLFNVRRRLRLVYGDRFDLRCHESDRTYSVTLSLPSHENQDTNS